VISRVTLLGVGALRRMSEQRAADRGSAEDTKCQLGAHHQFD
jgi:hypothetical protein